MALDPLIDNPLLSQVALSYHPIIDRKRQLLASRLSVFPLRPQQRLAAADLLAAVAEVWPAQGPAVSLCVRSEALLLELLSAPLPANVYLEIPHFLATQASVAQGLPGLAARGAILVLSGVPEVALPAQLLKCFRHGVVDVADERRVSAPGPVAQSLRQLGCFQTGIATVADADQAFERGILAMVGWPMAALGATEPAMPETGKGSTTLAAGMRAPAAAAVSGVGSKLGGDPTSKPAGKAAPASRPGLATVVQLINMVDAGEPIDKLDRQLRSDPALAYKLMRYLNSPLFGLSVEMTSFSHAIMMLGYQRLKRWLALLLVTADDDPGLRPVMQTAVRRGLILERLADGLADGTLDETARGEHFICGVFSLLDRMFQEAFDQLLRKIPVSDTIHAALAEQRGPLYPLLQLARTLEGGAGIEIVEAAEPTMLAIREVNRALLRGLAAGMQLN